MHVLSVLTWLPLLGGLVILMIPKEQKMAARAVAALASGATLVVSLWLWAHFSGVAAGFQFIEKVAWIPAFRIQYFLGVDGLSLPLLVLTTLLSLLAIIASFHIQERVKEYFFFFLLLETAMLGVFIALDLFLFYVFWELTLLPMYFLIGIWGGPKKEYAAIKFFLFTLFGSVFMLIAILALYFQSTPHTFDFTELLAQNGTYARTFQLLAFIGLYIGFSVKIPAFPLHTWLPLAHVEAPTAVSVILAGVLLKMGLLYVVSHRHAHTRRHLYDRRHRRDQYCVRCDVRDGADGYQTDDRVFVHQPYGVRDARHGVALGAGIQRRRFADGQPRHHHRGAVPSGGRDLRPGAYPRCRRVRRSGCKTAGLYGIYDGGLLRVSGPAASGGVCQRVPLLFGRVPGVSLPDGDLADRRPDHGRLLPDHDSESLPGAVQYPLGEPEGYGCTRTDRVRAAPGADDPVWTFSVPGAGSD